MRQDWDRVEELERRYERETLRELDYHEALQRFAALWSEAVRLNPRFGQDWEEDLAPDLAIARAVNGLPPRT